MDGSAVTMYDWGMPSVYHPDEISWTGEHINITYSSSHLSYSREAKSLCTGLLFVEAAEPVLLDIPCDSSIPNAVFLCERHAKNSSSFSLSNLTATKTACPHQWVAVQGDCYRLYKPNLTSTSSENGLCQNGEIVSYGHHEQFTQEIKTKIDVYGEFNEVLIFLALWLEDTNGPVILANNVVKNVSSQEKYILVWLQQFTENIATSPLSSLSGMKRHVTSFQGVTSHATSHVFCKTSHDSVRNSCERNQFTCDNGTCILDMYQCDGIVHCQDGSDEISCQQICHTRQENAINNNSVCVDLCQAPSCGCDGMFFECTNGGCVPWSHVCDCQRHCRDGSDEQSCLLCHHGTEVNYPPETRARYAIKQKEQRTFICGDKGKIPLDWVGDLVNDCHGTADDEVLYHSFLSTRKSNFTGCSSGETTCMRGFGKCFPVDATCAFETDTYGKTKYSPNGAHFVSCDMPDCQSRYKCPHSYCIEIHMVCDGKFDCPHGEDEGLFCERPSCPGMLRCSESSVCVHPRHIGDGTIHCVVSADDERVYPSVCEPLCKCHGMVKDCSFAKAKLNGSAKLPEAWVAINLQNNTLKSVPRTRLSNKLLVIDLSFNRITEIHPGEFKSLYNLHELRLKGNLLGFIQPLTFFGLSSLQTLALTANLISTLSANSFLGLHSLIVLHLDNNAIEHIASCAFGNLNKLKALILKRNNLTGINGGILCGLANVRHLDLSFNLLMAINLPQIRLGLTIHVHSVEYCCLLPRRIKCVHLRANDTGSNTCPRLLASKEIIIWFLVLAVFLPNIAAPICWRKMKRQHGNMTFLVSLLHLVDALTAAPILVVALADAWYGINYKRYAIEWSESVMCKGAAYLGYVNFIMSIGCITLITRQRYLGVAYPLHKRNISRRFAMISVFAIFIISSASILITLLMGSRIKTVQLYPLCLIYAQPSGGLKSNWFACLYVLMNVSVIPVTYYSIATVCSLTRKDAVLEKKRKNAKPAFKIVFTSVVYVLICGSLSIIEITNIWHPLTDVGRLVMFIIVFPLHSLTNPWMVTLIPCLQSVLCGFQKNRH